MNETIVVLLSIPGLRRQDLAHMPRLGALARAGDQAALAPSFPAVTCPVQMNMTTGKLPRDHGVVANGFYWRDRGEVEMWTAWNEVVLAPQIWDVLTRERPGLTSAAWFGLLSKGCGADYVCTPAPIHNPDGSESLWCYTKPTELYGELRDTFDHFPLHHFWGPLANIASSEWIATSAIHAAGKFRPNFFYIYLPHLDYAAQRNGPDSAESRAALVQLDEVLGRLFDGLTEAYAPAVPLWLVASEYTIQPVAHTSFPNRVLREAGLLKVKESDGHELLEFAGSDAWALVDHQFSHVFVRDARPDVVARAAQLLADTPGIAEVLVGDERARYDLDHERSGEVIAISRPDSWQAYYWWVDNARAPAFARTVDIHQKPGYDPLEMFFDPVAGGVPLDVTLCKGSHGAPARDEAQRGVIVASEPGVLPGGTVADFDIAPLVLRQFGL
ncbi:MAG: alkaline phosphatase family protein [Pirellulales bacterium]